MLFTGRLIGNAEVKTLKDNRQLVAFTVAINDSYKRKGNDVPVKTTLFVNCSYWQSTAVASHLTKGAIVELQGRISINAYNAGDEAKASLQAYVNTIKIHHTKSVNEAVKVSTQEQSALPKAEDDLPF